MTQSSDLYQKLSIVFSSARLSNYLRIAGQDHLKALELYKLNLKLSESLYPLLSVFEITLRNKIVNVLLKVCGNNWFYINQSQNLWLSDKISTHNTNNEIRWEVTQIEKVLQDISKRGIPPTSDRITAELTLGFWVAILDGNYDRILWNTYMIEVFPNTPREFNLARNKKELRKQIQEIRDLRNRVYHNEPIFCTHDLSFYNLLMKHDYIMKIIKFLSQDAYDFIKTEDQFQHLMESVPLNMKTAKEKTPVFSLPKLKKRS